MLLNLFFSAFVFLQAQPTQAPIELVTNEVEITTSGQGTISIYLSPENLAGATDGVLVIIPLDVQVDTCNTKMKRF